MRISEKAYANKWAITGHAIVDTVLFVSYVMELIKGSRTLPYVLFFGALTILPVVVEIIMYKKNRESKAIRHVVGTSYSLLYIFAMFTSSCLLPFTYAFPMFIIITLFSDFLYCMVIAIGAVIANIAHVIYLAVTVGYTHEQIPDLEIRIACYVLVCIFMVFTTYANKKISLARLQEINEKNDKTNQLLNHIMNISNDMMDDISVTSGKMTMLGEAVERIHMSMGEVSQGSTETEKSVQMQLEKTESIQKAIGVVKNTTILIENSMSDTAQIVDEGRNKMEIFAEQVKKSTEANDLVLKQMEELNEYTRQMNTIIETITSIANSTGMLALNASIEAARAGEAGKGFAVVASEISGLANQTKDATVNISDLIGNIHKELMEVANAVNVVTEMNHANVESTSLVRENFEGIARGTSEVKNQTNELAKAMDALEAANADIVEKIQTISAITEEVSAHANETFDSCEENAKMVNETSEIVKHLSGSAERLKNAN